MNYEALILCVVEVRRRLGVIPDSSPTVIKKYYLYFCGVQKMILNFDLKLFVVYLMSRSWMWSK